MASAFTTTGSANSPFVSSPRLPTRLYDEVPKTGEEAVEEMSDERRANLYQSLLRDLQVENVPLLGCDADQVHTLSAALWTTIAELSEQPEEQKACLILESIPMSALKAYTEDFTILKTQRRLMDYLPELERVSVSLVGSGVGPALLLEVSARTEKEEAEAAARNAISSTLDEAKCTAALKAFVDRIVIGEETCPYTKTPDIAAVGLEARGVTPAPVGYRFSPSSDVCGALSAFWTCICELLATPEDQLSTTVLSLPGIGPGKSEEAHNRFAAVVEVIGRNLCLFRGDGSFGLVHFHPAYERNRIQPIDRPAYGHLPPQSWLRPMMRLNGNEDEAESMTDEQLSHSDYQRRSPHTAINMLRVTQLNAAVGAKSIVDLDLGNGVTEKASGITTYSRNAIRLGNIDRETLDAAVDAEMAMEQ